VAIASTSAQSLVKQLGRARTSYWLRAANRVGAGVIADGRPFVANQGNLSFGDGAFISSSPVQSHFVVAKGGVLEIGADVSVSYGAAISAEREIRIGRGTRIGPFVVIMDSDFHRVGDRNAHAEPGPVRIGSGVVIESRVTILRGTSLGDGVRVRSGSVVSGNVPAGSVVGGVPARPIGDDPAPTDKLDLPELLQRVLGLSEPPSASDGPDQIPEWDSLGALKILLAMERSYGISIPEDQLKSAQSVARLAEIAQAARAKR
jgi:acetyltransferase-like isoleucine patch superfamily enzyme